MGLKSSEWLMLAVVAAAVVLILMWIILPNSGVPEFIDTKSIQISGASELLWKFR